MQKVELGLAESNSLIILLIPNYESKCSENTYLNICRKFEHFKHLFIENCF